MTVFLLCAVASGLGSGPIVTVYLDESYSDGWQLDLYASRGEDKPTILLFHGAGLKRTDYAAFADALAKRGALVLNVGWDVVRIELGRDQVACALLWASEHAMDYGGDPQRLFVVAHSTAVAITAGVTMSEEAVGRSCTQQPPPALGFVAVSGTQGIGPGAWPRNLLGGNPLLRIRFVHGLQDTVVSPRRSDRTVGTLQAAGYAADLVLVDGGHYDLMMVGEVGPDPSTAAFQTLDAIMDIADGTINQCIWRR